MTTAITLIDNTTNLLHSVTNKIESALQQQKTKLAFKEFEKNLYIQNYIKTFYDSFENTFIDDTGFLNRGNSFNFEQIPATLKEQLKEYMETHQGLYYYSDDCFTGFCLSTFVNIYIDEREHTIYMEYTQKTRDFKNPIDLFLNLELLQADSGCYPDIVITDYYGNYYADYKMPQQYAFLRTGQQADETRLLWFIKNLIALNHEDFTYYDENFIIEQFTPDFIKNKKDTFYKNVDILDHYLDSDFTLHIEFCLPVKLKEEQLKKLNIKQYCFNSYGETIITLDENIKDWLESELSKGHSFKELAA